MEEPILKSNITSRGQLVVPAKIRRKYGIKKGTEIYFIERNNEIILYPLTKNYIRNMCGILHSKKSITKELLKFRSNDKKKEKRKYEK